MRKLLKGQIWYFDLVIALAIFTLIIILSFKYISETFVYKSSDILEETKKFSDSLMSSGIPDDWNSSYFTKIGLLTNNTLDLGKLSSFNNMTLLNYNEIRESQSLKYDFLVLFEEGKIPDIEKIGHPDYEYADIISMNPEELVEIARYVTYRHDNIAEIISIKIVMWDAE